MSEENLELGSNLEPAESRKRAKKAPTGMAERTYIILEENEDIPPTGLFVGINGTSYLVKPGEPVAVPQSILDVLDNAVTTIPVTDPSTKRVIGHRERMRFPYRRVAAPQVEE